METKDIIKAIKDQGIDTIRIDYPDLYGVCRSKLIPAGRIEEILEEGMTCAQPIFAIMLNNDIPPGTGVADEVGYGDMKIIPDPATFSVVPYLPNTARFIGDLYVDEKPWANSPRRVLQSVIEEYNALGLQPIVASELEFYIFKENEGGMEYYCNQPCNCYTAGPRVDPQSFMRKLQLSCLEMGFDVLYYNHEFFQGQYEFNWKHTDALRMADQTFTFKALCKELGQMEDLFITFMGRPKEETGGSGFHVHYSLSDTKTGKNVFDEPGAELGLSDTAKHFIGGQLEHAKALTAFFAPTINSYKRYMPNSFAPTKIGWGLDNRTVYLRVPAERGKAARVEVRAACASANPYLMMAGMLLAGLDGIKKKTDPGAPYEGDMYNDPEAEKFECIPDYLGHALTELDGDEVIKDGFGPELVQNYLALKQGELEAFRFAVTDWEFNFYSYHI
jgi:glutamine synthetase